MKRNFEEEAVKLAKVIDLAVEAAEKHMIENDEATQLHMLKWYRRRKEELLNPQPEYKNLKTLNSVRDVLFTYFQEGKGETVEYFWKRIKEENLSYRRIDKLDKILKWKKIKNQEEFDFITDAIVPLRQQGEITEEQFESLASMLGDFEARAR